MPSSLCREPEPATLGNSQQWSRLEQIWDLESGSGDVWPGTGMAEAPQAWVKGSSPVRRAGPTAPSPIPAAWSCHSAPQRGWPSAQSWKFATHSGLPESFLLPGDFSSARSCDCSLKGRAFLAEGDIKFSLYQQ